SRNNLIFQPHHAEIKQKSLPEHVIHHSTPRNQFRNQNNHFGTSFNHLFFFNFSTDFQPIFLPISSLPPSIHHLLSSYYHLIYLHSLQFIFLVFSIFASCKKI